MTEPLEICIAIARLFLIYDRPFSLRVRHIDYLAHPSLPRVSTLILDIVRVHLHYSSNLVDRNSHTVQQILWWLHISANNLSSARPSIGSKWQHQILSERRTDIVFQDEQHEQLWSYWKYIHCHVRRDGSKNPANHCSDYSKSICLPNGFGVHISSNNHRYAQQLKCQSMLCVIVFGWQIFDHKLWPIVTSYQYIQHLD